MASYKTIKDIITSKNNKILKSMILNTLYKPVGMLISLIYIPLLLSYLGDENYGIWVTLLSVISWVIYFDVGIGNGLRNALTSYLTKDDRKKSQSAVSTAYTVLIVISVIVFAVVYLTGQFLDFRKVFNTNINVTPAVYICFLSICINFVLSLCNIQLYALQKAEVVGLLSVCGQILNVVGLLLISKYSSQSLTMMAALFGISSIVINMTCSLWLWKNYSFLRPSIRKYDKTMLHDICNVGFKFFGLQIAALILFTTDNLIITHLFGPGKVTPYNTVYKVFGLVNVIFGALIAPLWSRYTVAAAQNDYEWIKKTIRKLTFLMIPVCLILVLGILGFEKITYIWLGKELDYDNGLILTMGIYYMLYIYGSIYSSALNGIGAINLQLIMALIGAAVNIPLSIFLARNLGMGTTGVILTTAITTLIPNIVMTLQLKRICHVNINKGENINEGSYFSRWLWNKN